MDRKNPQRTKQTPRWLVFILIAIIAHIIILFGVNPRHLNIFRKSLFESVSSSSNRSSMPDAIVVVTVDVDGDEPLPIEIEELPRAPQEPPVIVTDITDDPLDDAPDDGESDDLHDILDSAESPRESGSSTRAAVIPPRPIEITWPETQKLSHCLGLYVDVRIRVSETGSILEVLPDARNLPGDCVSAAIRAARRIVFRPGLVDGHPREMWTEVRIEFRRQQP